MTEQKNKLGPDFSLRLFLGLVFLSAGAFRIFHWQTAIAEMSNLDIKFTYTISTIVVILEIIGGFFLIFNIQVKKAVFALAIFLTLTLLWTLIISWKSLIINAGILFTFSANPADFFLHFTYLIILIYLLWHLKKRTI